MAFDTFRSIADVLRQGYAAMPLRQKIIMQLFLLSIVIYILYYTAIMPLRDAQHTMIDTIIRQEHLSRYIENNVDTLNNALMSTYGQEALPSDGSLTSIVYAAAEAQNMAVSSLNASSRDTLRLSFSAVPFQQVLFFVDMLEKNFGVYVKYFQVVPVENEPGMINIKLVISR